MALGLRLLGAGPMLILVLLALAISLWTPNFLKPGNLANIAAQTAVIAIVAMGQQLVILTRGIDLSVGFNLALATVIGALAFQADRLRAAGHPRDARSRERWSALVNGVVYVYRTVPLASLHHHAGHA